MIRECISTSASPSSATASESWDGDERAEVVGPSSYC